MSLDTARSLLGALWRGKLHDALLAPFNSDDAALVAIRSFPSISVLLSSSVLAWGAYHRYDTAVLRLRTINEEQTRLCLEVTGADTGTTTPGQSPMIHSILQRRVLDLESAITAVRASAGIAKVSAVLQQVATVLSVVALVMSVVGKAGQHVETLLSSISWWFLAAGAMCVAAGACAQVVEVVISTTGLNEESYAALSGRKAPNVKTAISRYTYARQCMAVGRFDDAEAALVSNRAEEDLHGPAGHYLLAKIYLSRGNLDKARSHFQSAVTRDNTLWPARLELEAIAAGGAVRAGLGGRLFGRKGSAGTSPQNRASLESDGTTDDLTDKGHGGAPSTPRSMVGDAVTVATGWATQLANHAILLWAFVVYVGSRNGVLVTICLAFLNYLRGNGWQLRLPSLGTFLQGVRGSSRDAAPPDAGGDAPGQPRAGRRRLAVGPHQPGLAVLPPAGLGRDPDAWYVTEEDLGFFKYRVEQEGEVPGASAWSQLMKKDFPGATYVAHRRMLPTGKTEYRSVTVVDDATAEEFNDFFLDDPARLQWDNLLANASIVETGRALDRQCVVHWVREFPFAFIKGRDYCIARRVFRGDDGAIYSITKSCKHPRALPTGQILRCDTYYSMWRCVTIDSPFTPGGRACETTLLHHEDFRIPERLARFAVSAGMAGFLKNLVSFFQTRFRPERRQRAGPTEVDARAFGLDKAPSPLSHEEMAIVGVGPMAQSNGTDDAEADHRGPRDREPRRASSFRSVGSIALAGATMAAFGPASIAGVAATGVLVGSNLLRRRTRRAVNERTTSARSDVSVADTEGDLPRAAVTAHSNATSVIGISPLAPLEEGREHSASAAIGFTPVKAPTMRKSLTLPDLRESEG